ncbi:MAG: class I SAM-dependent methyltransferase [Burkholderiaceae bacterium]
MDQTPAHSVPNEHLVAMIPTDCEHVVDIGCMHGALGMALTNARPGVRVTGIDIDPNYAREAAKRCHRTLAANIETMSDSIFDSLFPSDCWVFGDCLEHLKDPWQVLRRVRAAIDPEGCLVVCIPNAQHWSVQWRLLSGNFRYEDSGLMDRTHLRWFTRLTLMEMFEETGWAVDEALTRILESAQQDPMLQAIASHAELLGMDPDQATRDARPFQYVFRLTPRPAH